MKVKYKLSLLGIIIGTFLLGCTKNPSDPEYQKEISVFGFLWGNEKLTVDHAVLVSFSQPIMAYYDLNEAAIQNAVVTITEASGGDVYTLKNTPQKPGYYFNEELLVKPKTTYNLTVEVDGKVVTASTTVPPTMDIKTELFRSDTVNYVHHTNLGYDKPIYLDGELEDQIILVDMFCNETYEKAEYIYPFHDSHKFPEDQEEMTVAVTASRVTSRLWCRIKTLFRMNTRGM